MSERPDFHAEAVVVYEMIGSLDCGDEAPATAITRLLAAFAERMWEAGRRTVAGCRECRILPNGKRKLCHKCFDRIAQSLLPLIDDRES